MRKILAAAIFAAIAASPLMTAPAQAQTPIKVMVGGIDKQIYLPAKLAAQLGFFKEQGLDVELFNSTSGSQAATALLAREVQGVVGFYDHTIDLQSKGKFITDVVQFSVAPGEVVLVKAADAEKLKDPVSVSKKHILRGVYGNIDGNDIRSEYPEQLIFNCEEIKVLIKHIGGYPGRYAPGVKDIIQKFI